MSLAPSPTWPNSFFPQHRTVASLMRAHVTSPPAEICVGVAEGATFSREGALAIGEGAEDEDDTLDGVVATLSFGTVCPPHATMKSSVQPRTSLIVPFSRNFPKPRDEWQT